MNGLSITIDSSETAAVEYSPYDVPMTPFAFEISSSLTAPNVSSRTRTVEVTQERLWNELSSLYSANEQLKTDSNTTSKDKDGSVADDIAKKLDSLLDSFMNGADVVLNELSALGNMHPILASTSPIFLVQFTHRAKYLFDPSRNLCFP